MTLVLSEAKIVKGKSWKKRAKKTDLIEAVEGKFCRRALWRSRANDILLDSTVPLINVTLRRRAKFPLLFRCHLIGEDSSRAISSHTDLSSHI